MSSRQKKSGTGGDPGPVKCPRQVGSLTEVLGYKVIGIVMGEGDGKALRTRGFSKIRWSVGWN